MSIWRTAKVEVRWWQSVHLNKHTNSLFPKIKVVLWMEVGLTSLSGGMICLNRNMRLESKNSSLGTFPSLSNKQVYQQPHLTLQAQWIRNTLDSQAENHSLLRMAVAAPTRLQGARAKNRLWAEAALQIYPFPVTSSVSIHETDQ